MRTAGLVAARASGFCFKYLPQDVLIERQIGHQPF
jgi:hypothetical protein